MARRYRKTGRPKGAPSSYTPEIGDEICRLVAAGEMFSAIAKRIGIDVATLGKWRANERLVVSDGAEFGVAFARARELSADALADLALDVIMSCPAARDSVAKARELAQHLRWMAACRKPQAYSERREVVVSGGTDNALTIRWQRPEEAQLVHNGAEHEPLMPALPPVRQ